MDALFNDKPFDLTDKPDSVRTIHARYEDIQEHFPEALKGPALPFFIDWPLGKVTLVEITAFSDEDAYAIFETMNDRGLSLSPTDMLKGYQLAIIDGDEAKLAANALWKQRILDLVSVGREEEADFSKAWLGTQHAQTIRERKPGATNQDLERIGTTFHKWVREETSRSGLKKRIDFREFVEVQFDRFSQHYIRLRRAAKEFTPGLEYV